ncbi:hypothetical protein J3Q64DRAFT_1765610, partial [Phycomyces blakesleeanus]
MCLLLLFTCAYAHTLHVTLCDNALRFILAFPTILLFIEISAVKVFYIYIHIYIHVCMYICIYVY